MFFLLLLQRWVAICHLIGFDLCIRSIHEMTQAKRKRPVFLKGSLPGEEDSTPLQLYNILSRSGKHTRWISDEAVKSCARRSTFSKIKKAKAVSVWVTKQD